MLAATRRCSPRPTTLPYYYHYHYYYYYFSHPSGLKIQHSPPPAPTPSSSAAALERIRNRSYWSCSIRFSSIPSIQPPSRRCRHHCAVHHQQHAFWFSTISSSSPPLDVKSGPLAIKVTVTGSGSNNNNENSNSNTAASSSSTFTSTTTTSSSSTTSGSSSTNNNHSTSTKSSDQIAEEEILSLQSELRVHFRHASYETALDTATQLLSRTVLQFGNLHPATASAYNNLGLMNKCLGKYVEAKDAYHEALRIYGTNIANIACNLCNNLLISILC